MCQTQANKVKLQVQSNFLAKIAETINNLVSHDSAC